MWKPLAIGDCRSNLFSAGNVFFWEEKTESLGAVVDCVVPYSGPKEHP